MYNFRPYNSENPQIIASIKGKPKLIFGGYRYNIHHEKEANKIWKCANSRNKNHPCNVRAETWEEDTKGILNGEHNHPPNHESAEFEYFKDQLALAAISDPKSDLEALIDEAKLLSPGIDFGNRESLKKSLKLARKKAGKGDQTPKGKKKGTAQSEGRVAKLKAAEAIAEMAPERNVRLPPFNTGKRLASLTRLWRDFDERQCRQLNFDDAENGEIVEEAEQFNGLLQLCQQQNVLNWQDFASSTSLENCLKLGEGTYGEVFKIEINGTECALKVIPFAMTPEECDKIVNGEMLMPPTEILNELSITKELSNLSDAAKCPLNGFITSGFIRLIKCAVVKGFYPEPLLKAWDSYQNDGQNQHPNEYATEDQHFILIALSNGGIDLETFEIQNQKESFSIFLQIAYSLAIAEEALEFEHRDLHIGNILIDKCDERKIIRSVYNGADVNIKSFGVRASIIDFTHSRILKNGIPKFKDNSEEEDLFAGPGKDKKDGDYQFDIYRKMRIENGNNWAEFTPKTNLLWLHYLSKKLFDTELFGAKKDRKGIMKMFNKLLVVERVRDFLNDAQFLKTFAKCREGESIRH